MNGADQDWGALSSQIPRWGKLARDADEQTPAGDGGQRMTAKTNAQRQAAYRQRKAAAELAEVRGIFAHPDDHAAIKAAAAKISSRRSKPLKRSP